MRNVPNVPIKNLTQLTHIGTFHGMSDQSTQQTKYLCTQRLPSGIKQTIPELPTDLPDWLNGEESAIQSALPTTLIHPTLEQTIFSNLFETVLDQVALGTPLASILNTDHREPALARFVRWIHADATRKNRYREAQEIGAEIIADQMIWIADANDSLEDVARSTLRINTRKWILGVLNRKRFGEVKQIEQNVTLDIGEAMQRAQERVNQHRMITVNGE